MSARWVYAISLCGMVQPLCTGPWPKPHSLACCYPPRTRPHPDIVSPHFTPPPPPLRPPRREQELRHELQRADERFRAEASNNEAALKEVKKSAAQQIVDLTNQLRIAQEDIDRVKVIGLGQHVLVLFCASCVGRSPLAACSLRSLPPSHTCHHAYRLSRFLPSHVPTSPRPHVPPSPGTEQRPRHRRTSRRGRSRARPQGRGAGDGLPRGAAAVLRPGQPAPSPI